jgi:hypothetical protein
MTFSRQSHPDITAARGGGFLRLTKTIGWDTQFGAQVQWGEIVEKYRNLMVQVPSQIYLDFHH